MKPRGYEDLLALLGPGAKLQLTLVDGVPGLTAVRCLLLELPSTAINFSGGDKTRAQLKRALETGFGRDRQARQIEITLGDYLDRRAYASFLTSLAVRLWPGLDDVSVVTPDRQSKLAWAKVPVS